MGLFAFPSKAALAAPQPSLESVPATQQQRATQPTKPIAKPRYYVQRFRHIRELARSSEGTIDLARHKSSGVVRVFKTVASKSGTLCQEARALSLLQSVAAHQNIIRMIHAEEMHDGFTVMCLQWCDGGDLWDQVIRFHKLQMAVPRLFILHCFVGVGEALAFIHHGFVRGKRHGEYRRACDTSLGLIHRDVKPENIFLDFSALGYGFLPTIKLGDFGQADCSFDGGGGTDGFRSPELEKGGTLITIKTDVYSYGAMMFEVCEGIGGMHWTTGLDPGLLNVNKRLAGLGFTDFLRGCLTVDPGLRLAMTKDGGLDQITAFRELRDKLAKTEPISSGVWAQKS